MPCLIFAYSVSSNLKYRFLVETCIVNLKGKQHKNKTNKQTKIKQNKTKRQKKLGFPFGSILMLLMNIFVCKLDTIHDFFFPGG